MDKTAAEQKEGKAAQLSAQVEMHEGMPEATLRDISIVLDNYDDIFSDFDPRAYGQRELSDDFLKELSKRYVEDSRGNFEVRFFIPAYERDMKAEALIKKRLKEHYSREMKNVEKETDAVHNRGIRYIVTGICILLGETFIRLTWGNDIVWSIIGVLILPAGWFAIWTGLERIFDLGPRILKQKTSFEKFAKCNYMFISQDRE